MKKYITRFMSGLAVLLFAATTFISCDGLFGGKGSSSSPIEISVLETKSETIVFDWEYSGADTSSIKQIEIRVEDAQGWLKFSKKEEYETKGQISAYPLEPDSEYTIKIKVLGNSYNTLAEKTEKVSTSELSVPELSIEYGDFSYNRDNFQITWDETGYSFKKQEVYVYTDADIPEGSTSADYDIEGKTPQITKNKKNYPTIYSYIETDKMQEHISPISDKKKHYFKLVCYNDDDSVFGSKVFECVAGVRLPPYLSESKIDIKNGTHSIKVSLDLTEYRQQYVFDKVRFEIRNSSIYNDEALIKPYTVDISDNTDDVVTITVPDFASDKSCYLYTYLINDAGERKCKEKFFNKDIFPDRIENAVYTLSQTSISLQIPVLYDYFEDDTTMTYTAYGSGSKVLYGYEKISASDSIVLTGITPEEQVYITTVRADVTWTDENGESKTAKYGISANFLKFTDGFDAPANFKVIGDPKTTELSFTFDELTEEQKYGKDIKYYLAVYDKVGTKLDSKIVTPENAKITNLKKGTEYTFKLFATSDEKKLENGTKFPAVLIANTSSGLSKPVITSTSYTANSNPLLADITVNWNKITEDTTNNVVYGIEYKIFKGHKFTTVKETFSKEDSYSKTITVNGGNRYLVRVYAYSNKEPTAISYSDVEEVKLPAIDDTKLYGALIYTNNVIGPKGSVVDLANNKMWENNAEIRSVKGQYNFGVISFLAGENVDPLKYGLPTGETAFNSVKMSYERALDSSNPRVIFMDRHGATGSSNFATFDELYIVKPDAIGGEIIKKFKTTLNADGTHDFLSDQVNMPFFGPNGTSEAPAVAGLDIDETWVFNNSIYIGVVQKTQGVLGFSYYY